MRAHRLLFALIVALGACSSSAADQAAVIGEAKAEIAKELGSPASAEFRNVRIATDEGGSMINLVCGEVKAASDQVVDAPFRRFLYARLADLRTVEREMDSDPETPEMNAFQSEFEAMWRDSCR